MSFLDGAGTSTRNAPRPRHGPVRVLGHALADDGGPFPGLGVSYFTALWRWKYDRPRLESDLAFLSRQGFHYYRMLSMVGQNAYWSGHEIAPIAFKNTEGRQVEAWPDYWDQLRGLVDRAWDRHGLRTQITVFADAQLMPGKQARIEHLRRLLAEVLPGREHKVPLIEVANEAWQNGFPGEQGVADLREFTTYLARRTRVLVATSSNHGRPFREIYEGSDADLATWHFSRDRRTDDGWKPVYDCWDLGEVPGSPPVSSNEPIGPGSSVDAETEPIRLVMAAAFAYVAKLPMYVFHSGAGVLGKTRFEDMAGIGSFRFLMRLLPPDLANWRRNDGKEADAPFTVQAGGCVRNTGTRKGGQFVCVPIGIRREGLTLEARRPSRFRVYDPLTGESVLGATLRAAERRTLPQGPGAYLILGSEQAAASPRAAPG